QQPTSLSRLRAHEAPVAPGQISAFPWEGVYLEQGDQAAGSMAGRTQPNPELKPFLAGRMYGE
uniref:hypothetical protein n=1 Tax=Arthrobacter globiformis TaxID=1665 RepID=UPI001C0F1B00